MNDIYPPQRLHRPRRHVAAAAIVAATVGLAGCASNPATGDRNVNIVSPAEEKRIGQENHPKIVQQFGGVYEGQQLQAYVNGIGQKLARQSELPNIGWTFTLLDSDVTNAFALPGGYVYITRGLMALAENESQLAAVVGHEIGHVTARHGAQRQTRGTIAQAGAFGLTILGSILGGADVGRAVGQVAGQGAQAYVASYSRDQEFEADKLGIRYNGRIGYATDGMAGFLSKLDAERQLIARLNGQEARDATYLDTHPPTPARIQRAREVARETTSTGDQVGQQAYLNRINGMIWGDSPEQGYVRGNTFAHPGLGIQFSVPENFRLQNSPSQVVAIGRGGAAIIFDTGQANFRGSMQDYVRTVWGKSLKFSRVSSGRINGQEAGVGLATANVGGRPANVRLVAIRGKEGETFRMAFISPTNQTASLNRPYQTSANSFRYMTNQEKRALKPLRIRLYTVRRGDTVARIARQQMDVSEFAAERLMLLNGLNSRSTLQAGQVLKVIKEG